MRRTERGTQEAATLSFEIVKGYRFGDCYEGTELDFDNAGIEYAISFSTFTNLFRNNPTRSHPIQVQEKNGSCTS